MRPSFEDISLHWEKFAVEGRFRLRIWCGMRQRQITSIDPWGYRFRVYLPLCASFYTLSGHVNIEPHRIQDPPSTESHDMIETHKVKWPALRTIVKTGFIPGIQAWCVSAACLVEPGAEINVHWDYIVHEFMPFNQSVSYIIVGYWALGTPNKPIRLAKVSCIRQQLGSASEHLTPIHDNTAKMQLEGPPTITGCPQSQRSCF